MIKLIFKFTSTLKQWLVCTFFFATIPLPLRAHFWTNYSLIFLRVFFLIFSFISPTNTPRMRNQSIKSTLQLLHFILTVQLTFPEYFYIFLLFCATPTFLPQGRHWTYERGAGRERPMTRKRARGPKLPRTRPRRRVPPTAPPFLGSPGRKQLEPLPTVETCQLVIPG